MPNEELKKSLREIILVTGIVEGFWISLGLSPEGLLIDSFVQALRSLGTGGVYIFLLYILPLVGLAFTVWGIWSQGGKLGLIALAFSFFGGILLLRYPILSLILVGISLILGWLAEED
jgi:hypothetical protein